MTSNIEINGSPRESSSSTVEQALIDIWLFWVSLWVYQRFLCYYCTMLGRTHGTPHHLGGLYDHRHNPLLIRRFLLPRNVTTRVQVPLPRRWISTGSDLGGKPTLPNGVLLP